MSPGYPAPLPYPGPGAFPQQAADVQGFGTAGLNTYGPGTFGLTAYPGYPAQPRNGLGTAALVLGIIGVVFFWTPFLGVVLNVLAVIFGGVGLSRARQALATNRGAAMAGLVLGIIGLALLLMIIVIIGAGLSLLF